MQLPVNNRIQERFARWSGYLVAFTGAAGLCVLAGWQFDAVVLKSWGQTFVFANPLSTVCILLCCIAFVPYLKSGVGNRTPLLTTIAGAVVLGIALIDVAGFLTGVDPKLDLVLYRERLFSGEVPPFRMTLNTSMCFIFLVLALLFLPMKSASRWKLSQGLLIPPILVSTFSLMSYFYQEANSSGFLNFIPMAIPTALGFGLLSIATLLVTPSEGIMRDISGDSGGSQTARILLPAAIIIPGLLGFIRLWGFRQGWYSYEFGVSILTVAAIVIFFVIIWYNAVSLNRRDMLRMQADRALRDREEQIHAIFTNAPEAIVVFDRNGSIIRWNPEAEHLFGWKSDEVTGRSMADTIIPEVQRQTFRKDLSVFTAGNEELTGGRRMELTTRRKDDSVLDVSMSVSPLTANNTQFFIGFLRNITEKKKNEARLNTFNQELFRQVTDKTKEITDVFERVTDGFIALDKDFNYTYINERAGQMIHRVPAQMIGRNVWEEFPAAVGGETWKAFNKAMTEQCYVMNTDHFEPLNIWQENHIYPSPDGLSVFIRDISRQKTAETAITEANRLADTLIDSLPGVFYFYNEQGRFIKWNRQFEQVTGYSGAEIAEMHPLQFFPSKDHAYMMSRIQDVFNTGDGDAESNFVTRTGQLVPYYFKATRIIYQGQPCLLGTGIDMKERKKAEAALTASEQKYKLLFESNPMPMWMVKLPEYKLIDVNYTALRKYRYTKAEFLAMNISDLMTDDEKGRKDYKVSTEFRGEYHAGIWKHKNKQGKVIYADIVTHDIYYQNVPVRLVLSNDVTDQYLAKERLEQSYDSIRELTEYLQNIREEERLHISREIHDELGQQLTVLKMDVSWLNKKIDVQDGPVRQKLTELLGLIDTTVKTVRRIASELRPTLLDDLGIQAAMEWHLEEFTRRSGIETNFDPPDNEVEVPENLKIGIFRIFQESLTNVARHSGAGSVDVSLKQKDNLVILVVKDNGHGFDEDKTRKKTLGLLGMKERSAVMGGDYKISSAPGEGTTVQVVVPIPVQKERV